MSSIWINPQGDTGGNGGGGTPSSVQWSDIKNKPLEFTPKAHTHVIADVKDLQDDLHNLRTLIKNNQENITLIIEGLDNYVIKEEGKELSSNDFTDELKLALEALIDSENGGITGDYVISVNGKSGVLELDKKDIGLENVLNQQQATKVEFDKFEQTVGSQLTDINDTLKTKANTQDVTNQLNNKANTSEVVSLLSQKVDKEEDKGLSTNDFTTAHKNKVEQFDTLSATISTHINDTDVHLTEEQKNLVDTLPEIATDVQALDNEIERILELLGEGGEVPETGVLEVIKKGHLYMLGNEIFDIIHKNKIVGTMAKAFVRDNIHLFESENFMYNTIEFNGIGQITSAFVRNPLPEDFEGAFKNVLDFSNMMLHDKLTINGELIQDFEMDAKWLGNTFKLGVSYDDFEDLTTSNLTLGKKASISLSLVVDITAPNFKPFSRGMGYNITNNTFIFEDLHDHTVKFDSKLIFEEDTSEIKNSLVYVDLESNIITVNKRDNHKTATFKYDVDNAVPLEDEWDKSLYIGIEPTIKNNKICDELLRRSGNVFPYIPERQANKMKPVLDNATMIHTLSMEMNIRPNVKFGTDELEKAVTANKDSQLNKDNLKNIIIVDSLEELNTIEAYDGLVAIISKKE